MKRQLRELAPFVAFAIAKLAFHTLTNVNYGFHRDELATLDDARHLAWGFVAYPPLTPFLGRLELMAFGTSLTGFRFLAAVAQCIAIILTALITRHLGGNRKAQWIAALATAIAPVSIASSSLFQYVAFDYLWWVLLAYFVVRLVQSETRGPRTEDRGQGGEAEATTEERLGGARGPRPEARGPGGWWWVAIGITIGLGAMTKYTIAFLIAGLAVGFFLSPLRRHLRSRWFWLGVAISIVIVTPHFIWQWQNHFITLDFLKHIHERDVRIGRTAGFLSEQLWVPANPVTIPLWIAGLYGLFFAASLRRFRILGWMAIVPFVLFLIAQGRSYYVAPIYPMLFAAGAVVIPWRRMTLIPAVLLLLVGSSVIIGILPLAPIESRLGRFAIAQNGDLKEEIGWPEMTAEVARIWSALPAEERKRTAIFAANYGEAGAIDLYGPRYGLPPAISTVNSFWARGYGNVPPETVIVLGAHRDRLEARYKSVVLAGHIPNPHHLDNEESEHAEIFICRGLRMSWPVYWSMIRSFG